MLKEVIGLEMTPRKEKILSSVVNSFVKSGEPVGSKAIAEEIGVSSATVRNEMADLIELGFLEQPHTSAGRIPSQKGYREYVDRLLEVPELSEKEKRYLDSALVNGAYEQERLLSKTVRLLSSLSRFCAVATTPSGRAAKVKAVQFVQTSRRTAMLLLMSSVGTIKTRVFHCDFDLTPDILRVFFRAFNEKVTGKEVAEITPAFLQSMGVALGEFSILAGSPLIALLEVAKDTMETEFCFSGQTNLLFYPELELGGTRRILDFLEREKELIELFSQKPGRASVLIGKETGQPELFHSSVVSIRYLVEGENAGALALIGPVRMDYGRMIALLEYLAKRVSDMLSLLMREE